MFDLMPFRRRTEDAFERMLRTFDDMFEDRFPLLDGRTNSFRLDIAEDENAYYVEAELPGFDKDDIVIEYDNNYLTIRAERDEIEEAKDKKEKFIRRERRYGKFVRQFYVDNIKEDEIKATLNKGILNIEIPKLKTDEAPPRKRIEID